jgi:hypothetical protein
LVGLDWFVPSCRCTPSPTPPSSYSNPRTLPFLLPLKHHPRHLHPCIFPLDIPLQNLEPKISSRETGHFLIRKQILSCDLKILGFDAISKHWFRCPLDVDLSMMLLKKGDEVFRVFDSSTPIIGMARLEMGFAGIKRPRIVALNFLPPEVDHCFFRLWSVSGGWRPGFLIF